MRYPAILAAAAAAATVFAVPAVAEGSASVKYSDLDLTTKAGQAKLERRIDSAAREACGMDRVQTGRFTPSTAQRECYQKTKASVGEQVAQMIARDTPRG